MPGFKDFIDDTELLETDCDDLFMKQAVMKFASAAARDADLAAVLREGMVAWLDDVNWLTVYDGTAWRVVYMPWTVFTPTVGGAGWAIGNGTVAGAYMKTGLTYHTYVKIVFGSTSTFGAGAPLQIGGFPSDFNNVDSPHGLNVTYQDKSITTFSPGHCNRISANTVECRSPNASFQWVATSSTVPIPWATTDEVIITGNYQGAT